MAQFPAGPLQAGGTLRLVGPYRQLNPMWDINLTRLSGIIQAAALNGCLAAADAGVAHAKDPSYNSWEDKSGTARNSIQVLDVTQNEHSIVVKYGSKGVEYFRFLEFGTSKMPGFHVLYRSSKFVAELLAETIAQQINDFTYPTSFKRKLYPYDESTMPAGFAQRILEWDQPSVLRPGGGSDIYTAQGVWKMPPGMYGVQVNQQLAAKIFPERLPKPQHSAAARSTQHGFVYREADLRALNSVLAKKANIRPPSTHEVWSASTASRISVSQGPTKRFPDRQPSAPQAPYYFALGGGFNTGRISGMRVEPKPGKGTQRVHTHKRYDTIGNLPRRYRATPQPFGDPIVFRKLQQQRPFRQYTYGQHWLLREAPYFRKPHRLKIGRGRYAGGNIREGREYRERIRRRHEWLPVVGWRRRKEGFLSAQDLIDGLGDWLPVFQTGAAYYRRGYHREQAGTSRALFPGAYDIHRVQRLDPTPRSLLQEWNDRVARARTTYSVPFPDPISDAFRSDLQRIRVFREDYWKARNLLAEWRSKIDVYRPGVGGLRPDSINPKYDIEFLRDTYGWDE